MYMNDAKKKLFFPDKKNTNWFNNNFFDDLEQLNFFVLQSDLFWLTIYCAQFDSDVFSTFSNMDIQANARKVRYSVQAIALVVHTHESTLFLGSMVENLYERFTKCTNWPHRFWSVCKTPLFLNSKKKIYLKNKKISKKNKIWINICLIGFFC